MEGNRGYATLAFTQSFRSRCGPRRFAMTMAFAWGTGTRTTISESTITPVTVTDHVLLRGEVRFDKANQSIFRTARRSPISRRPWCDVIFVY